MKIHDHIGILVRNADLVIANYVKKQLEPFQLAPEQNLIMMMLWNKDGIAPNEFSAELKKDKANIARMIASLEKKGYIKRTTGPSDKRTYKVHLTEDGKRLEHLVLPVLQETHQTVMKGISSEQYVVIQDLLSKMMNNALGGKIQ
ncbi:MarR family transcriptional regulator [Mesobacillus maritimus]|uniref:MarR family winged helix-turn-helix transcriptional regulator n=1 Tax=Mesobacillus maritimus TaxID=1643336 RepID=UPI00203CF28D|nr:MarR family transcriptional regulator [Mesobacillus maritimus]MCM3670551.1 MarR family transcriptional regulator [Mesobacillus maritimus]